MTRSQEKSRAGTLASRGAQLAAQVRIGKQPFQCGPERRRIARRHDDPGLAVDDEIEQATHTRCHDGTAVRHRLETGDAEALTARRACDHRSARVELLELVVRHEPTREGDAFAKRAVTRDDQVQPCRRVEQLEHALLRRETTRIEHLGRLGLGANALWQLHAARNHAHFTRAENACAFGEVVRRGDHQPCPAQNTACKPGRPSRKLHIRPPHLHDIGRAAPLGDPAGRKPVGV